MRTKAKCKTEIEVHIFYMTAMEYWKHLSKVIDFTVLLGLLVQDGIANTPPKKCFSSTILHTSTRKKFLFSSMG